MFTNLAIVRSAVNPKLAWFQTNLANKSTINPYTFLLVESKFQILQSPFLVQSQRFMNKNPWHPCFLVVIAPKTHPPVVPLGARRAPGLRHGPAAVPAAAGAPCAALPGGAGAAAGQRTEGLELGGPQLRLPRQAAGSGIPNIWGLFFGKYNIYPHYTPLYVSFFGHFMKHGVWSMNNGDKRMEVLDGFGYHSEWVYDRTCGDLGGIGGRFIQACWFQHLNGDFIWFIQPSKNGYVEW